MRSDGIFDPDDLITDSQTRARVPTTVLETTANASSDVTEKPFVFRRSRGCTTFKLCSCRLCWMSIRYRSRSNARAPTIAPRLRDAWRGPSCSLRAIVGPAAGPEGASRAIIHVVWRRWRWLISIANLIIKDFSVNNGRAKKKFT